VTAPIPEEEEQSALPTEGEPPGEHDDELPDAEDGAASPEEQERNAETTEDQPSQ
jgi:hypothetical protein